MTEVPDKKKKKKKKGKALGKKKLENSIKLE